MGWQSYVFGCDSKDRLNKVMAAIEKHNALCNSSVSSDWEKVGEPLGHLGFCKQKKRFGRQDVLFVLCGHGGGRSNTFSFFEKEGVHVWAYNSAHKKRLEGIEYTYDADSTSI